VNEPRYWRTPWRDELFTQAIQCFYRLRMSLSALETELSDDVKKRSYPLPVSGMDDNVGLDSNGALVHQWNEAAPHTNKHPLINHTLPGTSGYAYMLLPIRCLLFLIIMALLYPLLTLVSLLRAIFLRLTVGSPSQILKTGGHGNVPKKDDHYPGMQLFQGPLDEAKFRAAVFEVAAEGGITEENVLVEFCPEEVNDWPERGSHSITHWLGENAGEKTNYFDFIFQKKTGKMIRYHIFNAKSADKPTLAYYGGSGNAWDGSANFNFCREVQNRYVGNVPNKVFQAPEIDPESAKKFDQGSFACFLCKMPYNIAMNLGGFMWNALRAAKWAGGSGFGLVGNPSIAAMNFSNEESRKLYLGAKKLGAKPFSCFTYAAVKACREVYGESPSCITQQASLQTRHYPVKGPKVGDGRSLVGDWLIGPSQPVGSRYELADAQKGYEELYTELKDVGPATRSAFWAKAYGLVNSGAALFELLPTYNDTSHVCDRSIFMNNYGVRTMPEGSPFHSWNWNAPFWLGVNTINVNGRTTTLVGSMMYGQDTIDELRNNMEETLRGIMAQAPAEGGEKVPSYDQR